MSTGPRIRTGSAAAAASFPPQEQQQEQQKQVKKRTIKPNWQTVVQPGHILSENEKELYRQSAANPRYEKEEFNNNFNLYGAPPSPVGGSSKKNKKSKKTRKNKKSRKNKK
jgi:hypothetical protein